ncbi:exonuclease 1 [Argentina anserina]|uniref:exonuclease 1 n=1 Tax=Argentina anserina TaxID=57926 RepID=UPI0021766956|nr:exonuclease 1 [Potentilla anserina]
MGIQGLLPLLKSIMEPIHIKDLKGCSVAIDTYSWLHKGALSCSRDLCQGLPTSRHIDYCMHRVNLLRHYCVKPVLVFDGGLLPMKGEQENKRARARKVNLARAIEHDSNGNSSAAYECYQKAVDISPSIALELIQVLKRENVSYVVAPYEADAQMTFLAISKQVEAVITEDSDLIPFGCPRIIYKMDKFGQGVEFQYSRLPRNKDLSFAGFTKQMILEMCILSGCDYLQSLPGMGLKRAHALIKKFTSYDKVIKHLKYSTVSVPPLYEESFKKAILTFQHQRVYDPISQDIVHLSDLSDDVEESLDFLGPSLPRHIAKGIAEGDLDPFTNTPFQQQKEKISANTTSQPQNGNFGNTKKKLDLPVQNNLLTKYFCFASLESKRKFRAPRSSPDDPSPVSSSSLSLDENTSVDDAYGKTNFSGSSLGLDEHVSVDDAVCTANDSKFTLLYPEHIGNLPPCDSVEDSIPTDLSESPDDALKNMAGKTRSPDSTLLQQPRHSIHKPCLTLHRERECKNAQGTFECKTRTENKKVIVRSSYFKGKSTNEDIQEDKQEKLLLKDSLGNDMHDNADPEIAPFKNSLFLRKLVKRKISPNDSFQEDDVKLKQLCTDASLPDIGPCGASHEATLTDPKTEEEKFGSNISHLGRYSDIAEKSMENFVSVISSFRFGSSGSRASGLRAPLKDVRNTCTNRTTVADFSQFEYVPNNQKTKPTSRKRRI